MNLTMLGTGNALVTECYNTCFVLEENGKYFMVDGGGGNFEDIQAFANITEKRLPGNTPSQDELIAENRANFMACNEYGLPYVLIDEEYEIGYESIIGLLP